MCVEGNELLATRDVESESETFFEELESVENVRHRLLFYVIQMNNYRNNILYIFYHWGN